jgi:hypothetical protein
MSINIESASMYRVAENGNVVDEGALSATYDGNTLNIEGFKNDEPIFMRLDNSDIMKLLATPASDRPLEQRLLTDFTRHPTRKIRYTPYKSKSRSKSTTKSRSKSTTKSRSKSRSKSTTKSRTPRMSTISPRHTIKPSPLYVDDIVARGVNFKRKKHTKKNRYANRRKTHRKTHY